MIGRGNQRMLMPLSFIALGLALAWMIYQQLQGTVSANFADQSASTPEPVLPEIATQVAFRMPPMRKFDAILQRPLFSQTRRPLASAPASPVVVSQNLGLSLIGITIASDGKFALVMPVGGGESLRLREGQDYRGWTLSLIEAKNIVFEREGFEERLELSYDVAPPAQPKKKTKRKNAKAGDREAVNVQRRKKDTGNEEDQEIVD